jgi:hypothetical protein
MPSFPGAICFCGHCPRIYQAAAAAKRKAEAAAAGEAPSDSMRLFGGAKLASSVESASASASASAAAAVANAPKWLFPPPTRPPFDANSKVSDPCFLNHTTVLMAHLDLAHAGDRLKVEWRAREKSAFACELLKQNDAGKLQTRHFLITSHAIYNFLPGTVHGWDRPCLSALMFRQRHPSFCRSRGSIHGRTIHLNVLFSHTFSHELSACRRVHQRPAAPDSGW